MNIIIIIQHHKELNGGRIRDISIIFTTLIVAIKKYVFKFTCNVSQAL